MSATPQFLAALRRRLGDEVVRTDPGECWAYGADNSRRQALPAAVLLPADAGQVAAAVALCSEHRVPLTSRGRGTATTGAAVPDEGGVVLCLERLGDLRIDAANRVAVVQPGVTNGELQRAAGEAGFFWPPDPTSADYSTVGGNLACNSAGPRAVKYGTPRENTLGLQAVTGSGRLLRTGVYTTKGVIGYDLTRLLIGSEGTLAIITEATLRLTPLPEGVRALRAVYRDIASAAAAVSRIMAQPTVPRAVEFMDGAAIGLIRDRVSLPEAAGALLLIEVDGALTHLDDHAAAIEGAARGDGLLEFLGARDEAQRAELWSARKALSPALRTIAPKKINEDVVVPVSRLAELVTRLTALAGRHGVAIVNFGHAGNGNIHVNLLGDPDDEAQMRAMRTCLDEVFDTVIELGGTLSGEHGIGLDKRDFLPLAVEPETLALMRAIKAQFDPAGILNPGKLFPAA